MSDFNSKANDDAMSSSNSSSCSRRRVGHGGAPAEVSLASSTPSGDQQISRNGTRVVGDEDMGVNSSSDREKSKITSLDGSSGNIPRNLSQTSTTSSAPISISKSPTTKVFDNVRLVPAVSVPPLSQPSIGNSVAANSVTPHLVAHVVPNDEDVATRVAAQISNDLHMRLEQMMNAQIVRGYLVTANDETAAQNNTFQTLEGRDSPPDSKDGFIFGIPRKTLCFLFFLGLGLVGGAVGGTIAVMGDSDKAPAIPVTDAPTATVMTRTPTIIPISNTLNPRLDDLLQILGSHIAPNNTTEEWSLLNDPESSQGQALRWLSEEDEYSSDVGSVPMSALLVRYALAVLYFATSGPEWQNDFRYLNGSKSVCQWNNGVASVQLESRGVYCMNHSASGGPEEHVYYVNLKGSGLNGSIPVEVGLLSEMRTVYLEENVLSGTLPREIIKMLDLEVLHVNGNVGLTGSVPDEFSSLANLKTLRLEDTSLTGSMNHIFCNVANKSTEVSADCGGTSPEIVCSCCRYCCSADGASCVENDSPTSPPQAPFLSPSSSVTNTPTIGQSQTPEILLPTNHPTSGPNTPTHVATRQPTDVPVQSSPTAPPTVAPLHLPTSTPVEPPSAVPVLMPNTNVPTSPPTAVPTKAPTNAPTFSPTNVPTEAATTSRRSYILETFIQHLTRDNTPEELALFDDPTTPQAQALQWLSEDDNFSSNPESVEDRILLERYALAVLYFSTSGADWSLDFPYLDGSKDICEWNNDEAVGSSSTKGVYCTISGSYKYVTYISLSGLGMSGSIPWEISLVVGLYAFYVHDNGLTGTIPPELAALDTLKFIWADRNSLSGQFPGTWGGKVEEFGFVSNLLSGTFPAVLATDHSKLVVMDFGLNQFRGTLPAELLGDLNQLFLMNFEGSQLTGTIPTKIGLMTNVARLYLDNNELTGKIPSEIGNLSKLQAFYIYGNEQITGTIPATFANLESLEYFDFDNTALTGSLDSIFCPLENDNDLELTGDCLGSSPEIECSCCYICCTSDGSSCKYM